MNFFAIHLLLALMSVAKVVIVLMIRLVKCVPSKTDDVNLKLFSMVK